MDLESNSEIDHANAMGRSRADISRLRGAIESLLTWFDNPLREEWLNDSAWEGAKASVANAKDVLNSTKQ